MTLGQFNWVTGNIQDNRMAHTNEFQQDPRSSIINKCRPGRQNNQKLGKILENNFQHQVKQNGGMRPLAFLRNSILPPLADSIEEEDQENEFENPNKKSSKAAIMITEDDGEVDPKFMSFGENQSRNYDQPLDDSYNDDQLSSFQPSPLDMVEAQINYNDTDITISRNQQNMQTDVSTQDPYQNSNMRR